MRDWYKSYRATLEKSVREARNVYRQAVALPGVSTEEVRATNADIVGSLLDVYGTFYLHSACCTGLMFYLVLSEKALITLAHLEKVALDISNGVCTPTRAHSKGERTKRKNKK